MIMTVFIQHRNTSYSGTGTSLAWSFCIHHRWFIFCSSLLRSRSFSFTSSGSPSLIYQVTWIWAELNLKKKKNNERSSFMRHQTSLDNFFFLIFSLEKLYLVGKFHLRSTFMLWSKSDKYARKAQPFPPPEHRSLTPLGCEYWVGKQAAAAAGADFSPLLLAGRSAQQGDECLQPSEGSGKENVTGTFRKSAGAQNASLLAYWWIRFFFCFLFF